MLNLPDLTKIRKIRRNLEINQKDIERDLNIPQATISRIESGKGNPSYLTVKRISDYLDSKRMELEGKKAEDIMTRNMITIDSQSTIKEAVNLMYNYKLSQLPIIEDDQNLGSITAKKLQKIITDNHELINTKIELIKENSFPEVNMDWDIKKISNMLASYPAVLVKDKNEYVGIITDADLLKFA
jgi:predicted transcriptional regulator